MNRKEGMNELEIAQCLKNVKDFNGVLSYDRFPSKVLSGYYVVNSGKSNSNGEHWLVMYFPRDNIMAEFFDSLALSPNAYNKRMEFILFKNASAYKKSAKQIQRSDSALCGQYCVLYCYLKSKYAFSMEDYLNVFSDDLLHNDRIVKFWEKCP